MKDTTKIPGEAHLLGIMAFGQTKYIEQQEKEGQIQLLDSNCIPRKCEGCTQEELRALGFVFGEELEDELFIQCQLPEGWRKIPGQNIHGYWTDIVDSTGEIRASMFYKAAFYDRVAHICLIREYKMSIKLGDLVVDSVTGYTGITTARVEYLNGCIQFCVEPNELAKDALFPGFEKAPYIDEGRLKKVPPKPEENDEYLSNRTGGGFMKNKPRGLR